MGGHTGRIEIQIHYGNNEEDDNITTRKICSRESWSFICIACRHWFTSHLCLCTVLFLCVLATSPSCTSMHTQSLLLCQGLCSCCSLCMNALLPASSLWPSSVITSLKYSDSMSKIFPSLSTSHILSHLSISSLLRSLHTL